MLYIAGIIVSVYLLILFIAKPNKTIADRILTIWQFLATIHICFLYLYVTKKYFQIPVLIGWEMALPFVHGPLLYLYTLYVTNQQKYKYTWILHFIPAVAAFILWLPLIMASPQEKLAQYQGPQLINDTRSFCYIIGIIISGISYIIASLVLLLKHKKNISSQFSYSENINLNWLLYLICGIGVIWLFVIFYRTEESLFVSVSLFIFFIGFFGIRQQGIFNNNKRLINQQNNAAIAATKIQDIQTEPKVKYENSTLTDGQADSIFGVLEIEMNKNSIFTNAQLTLADVAQIIQVPPAILSQVINTRAKKNFYDYINSHRVASFKKLVNDPQNEKYTLLSIAFECGFNSKSSFNRNFKKLTGSSPSAYLKKQNIHFKEISS